MFRLQPYVHDGTVQTDRRGAVLILAACLLAMVAGFVAFSIDLGYVSLVQGQLQKSADAAALAAIIETYGGWGSGAQLTPSQIDSAARQAAQDVAGANEAGGLKSTYLNRTRDVRLGQIEWNTSTGQWVKNWGATPYNLVEVTLHRDQSGSSSGDRPLDLFFAPLFGRKQANTHAVSTCAMLPGVGLRKIPGQNVGVLPIALDVYTWNALMSGSGTDDYAYDKSTGAVTSGSDGILEVNLYPGGDPLLPAGNRGTVDFGSSGNSTADLARQIVYGLNDQDLADMGGEIRFDDLPIQLNGDTGLSAGIKDELNSIKGQPRLIPLFSSVSGPGNNAYYTIVKFVPIRILYVQLTGKPSSKQVIIQPAPYVSATVIAGGTTITSDTIFAPASLIQ